MRPEQCRDHYDWAKLSVLCCLIQDLEAPKLNTSIRAGLRRTPGYAE